MQGRKRPAKISTPSAPWLATKWRAIIARINPGLSVRDGMDFELPEELRLLKDNLRKFVDRELIPLERAVVNDIGQQKELQKQLRPKVEQLGIWQYDVPEEFGGLGLGMLAKVIV